MKVKGHEFWVGRFAVEIAVALTALESGNESLARAGLQETIDEFLETGADQDLVDYLEEMRLEQQTLTPILITYRQDAEITEAEIARRL